MVEHDSPNVYFLSKHKKLPSETAACFNLCEICIPAYIFVLLQENCRFLPNIDMFACSAPNASRITEN